MTYHLKDQPVTIFLLVLLFVVPHAVFAEGFRYETAVVVTSQGDRIRVDLADTPAKRQLGLGQRDSLAQGEGMLFVFEKKTPHGFWMKGMRFPIDILWLNNHRVVHIADNVAPPKPGGTLETITPAVSANFVLELPAGEASALGIRKGSYLKYRFNP